MSRLSVLLLPALVAACTPMSTPAAAPPMAPPAANMAPAGFPMGTYTTTVVAGDVPAGAQAGMSDAIVGPWAIAFGSNGHALVTFNGRQVVDAPFTINGNQLIFSGDDTGEYACHSQARYTWHAAGNELHLTRLEDTCDGRPVVLIAHALVRR
jgi:hypothetical protein